MRYADILAIACAGYGPRIGGAIIYIIQKDCINQLLIRDIDNTQCVSIHPSPLQLAGGDGITGEYVRDIYVFAVGADNNAANGRTSVR